MIITVHIEDIECPNFAHSESSITMRDNPYFRVKDVYIPTRHETERCVNIFLTPFTKQDIRVLALLSLCPYGKGVYALEWDCRQAVSRVFPDVYGSLQDQRTGYKRDKPIALHEGLACSRLFITRPLEGYLEGLGFPCLVLNVATSTKDMDIFLTITNVAPDGSLVELEGDNGERSVSVSRGHMRFPHRELDSEAPTEHLIIFSYEEAVEVKRNEQYIIKLSVQPISMVYEKRPRIQIDWVAKIARRFLA